MTIFHFLAALIFAVVIMPKSPASLNEMNDRIVKKYEKEPSYIVEMDGELFELDRDKRRLINARWINELELVKPSSLTEGKMEGEELVFLVKLKERKEDNFRTALQVRSLELQTLNVRYRTD